MKKILTIACILLLSLTVMSCSDKKQADAPEEIVNPITITLSFADSDKDEVEAKDFEPITDAEFVVEEGTSVMDATELYCIANDLEINIDSSAGYISGMLGLNEKDLADTTGWTFTVNDEMVMDAASNVECKDGDKITWEFVDFSTFEW